VLLERRMYADICGKEIVFEAGDIPTVQGEQLVRVHAVIPRDDQTVEVRGWPLNSHRWPDGREVQFTLPVVTFNARRNGQKEG
jgi:hypothetical protein